MKYLKLLFAIPFIFLTACGEDPDSGEDQHEGQQCTSVADCPIGWNCNQFSGLCEPGNSGGDTGTPDSGDSGHSSDTGSDTGTPSEPSEDPDDPITGSCTPGKQQVCPYSGPEGTRDVGACKAGVRTCKEDNSWGPCIGEVQPKNEIGNELCSNNIDDDCNGVVDDGTDFDGDGYGACTDCCETASQCAGYDPVNIHPGAYEMSGDGIDNNCDGQTDESNSCDSEDEDLVVGDYTGNAVKLAHALGICGDQLVSAEISLAGEPVTENIADNGEDCDEGGLFGIGSTCTSSKSNRQSLSMPYYDNKYKTFAAATKFGNNITPKEGSKIAVLSTGPWNKPTKDASVATLKAGDMKTASKIPSDWINMMPNCTIPKSPTCGGTAVQDGLTNQCEGKTIPSVQDPIMLTLKIKAPMNARAFEFNLFFFSVEYPSTVCAKDNYNDFFIALLDSEHNTTYPNDEFQNPYDKNLAKDYNGNFVGVDLAPEGLFTACYQNSDYSFSSYCTNGSLIDGTGFDVFSPKNGGTGWLTTRGNVVPGETITLRLALWEQGTVSYGPDHSWDSTVLLDGFKWLPEPAKAGTDQY
jgi:hypothetical protein